jgi:hypothetical protein
MHRAAGESRLERNQLIGTDDNGIRKRLTNRSQLVIAGHDRDPLEHRWAGARFCGATPEEYEPNCRAYYD